jgi:hypothetical protein
MKKTIFFLSALTLYISWTQLQPTPASKPSTTEKIELPKHPALLADEPKSTPAPLPIPIPVEDEAHLREKLAQLDHELARAGYPEVLVDERLSEAEREELISKVLLSTRLYSQIVRQKLAALQGSRK